MSTPITAARAYANLARLTNPAAGVAPALGDKNTGTSFGSVLKQAMSSVVEASRKSDAQTQAMAAGKANIVDVVTAVAETEVAVETLVSVRDRVVQAYEEIMKMPI